MATYTGIKKIKIGDNTFELAVDWSNVTNQPTIPTDGVDEKLKTTFTNSGTIYYPIVGTNTTNAETKYYNSNYQYYGTTGSSVTKGESKIILGNSINSGAQNNSRGILRLYSEGSNYIDLRASKDINNFNWRFYIPIASGATENDNYNLVGASSVNGDIGGVTQPIYIEQGGLVATCNAYPTVPSQIVNTITTYAGTHTTINSQTNEVSFNIPTRTSHLINDSGFITVASDEKLALMDTATDTSGVTYYPIIGSGTAATIRQFDSTGFVYYNLSGGTNVGSANLTLGNAIAQGEIGNKRGQLILYGSTEYSHTITGAPSAARSITLPDKTGIVALTSDIPTKTSQLINNNSVIKIETSPTTASDGTIAVTTGTSTGTNTTYVAVKGLGEAAYKEVTDNSNSTSISFNDTNLITGRTLYYAGYTKNTGTVTQVIAGTGLSIGTTAQGSFTSFGTINHTNSVIEKSIQAVYPITFDAQGHITSSSNAVTIPTATSQLTNDSNFITSGMSSAIPVVNMIVKFDSSAHISSTDMTSQEISDFIDNLNAYGTV